MSLHSFHVSTKLFQKDLPFSSLIMAAMRKADTDNAARLRFAFPDIWDELQRRYSARLGVLPEDNIEDLDALATRIAELNRKSI